MTTTETTTTNNGRTGAPTVGGSVGQTPTERPILFSGEMVRALLDGRKTQTRRVLSSQPPPETRTLCGPEVFTPSITDRDGGIYPGPEVFGVYHPDDDWGLRCPYGAPGDRLWVREAMKYDAATHAPGDHIWATYTADGAREEIDGSEVRMGRVKPGKSYPSIHMPRWASRLTLEITDVRVERVGEISERDARAEGVQPWMNGPYMMENNVAAFQKLWDSINGSREGCSWEANPFVWVVSFRVASETQTRQAA